MSKGSKPRPADPDKFGDNFDKIFSKGKRKRPKIEEDYEDEDEQDLPWSWAKEVLIRQEEMQRKKKNR